MKAARKGDAKAQFEFGGMYYDGKNYKKAHYWWEKAAKQGYLEAQFKLGDMYYDGDGVLEDLERSAYWYEKAAESGDAEAQSMLAKAQYELSKMKAVEQGQ